MSDTPPTNPFTDVGPYRPPKVPDIAGRRPGGLTAICIIAVVLAVIGLFSGALKGVNVLFGAEMQRAFGSMGAASAEQAQAQQEMQEAIAVEMNRFAVANGILSISQLVLCGVLMYSGLRALGLKLGSRKLLWGVCACLLVYEVGQLIVFIVQQLSMSPIMELYMPRMMKDPSGNNAGAEQFGQIIARMSIIVGIVTQCVWVLIKFVFYAVAVRYLCQPKIVALFDTSPAPAPLPSESL